MEDGKSGPGYWKFNNSLLQNKDFCNELKTIIEHILLQNDALDHQVKWELVKYKIRDFSIGFSKKIAKQNREKTALLEEIVSDFESKSELFSTYTEDEFLQAKNELELIYENKTKGYILR